MIQGSQVKIIDANVILRYLLDCFICVRSKKLKLGILRIAVVSDTHIGFRRTCVAESFGHSYRSLSDT